MNETATKTPPCPHCGQIHTTTCPHIASIEYHPDGSIKRIEFVQAQSQSAADAAISLIVERCAKVAETEGVHPELNIYAGGPDWYRHGRCIAARIRSLASEKGGK